MNSDNSSGMGSSCPNSVSFPNTITQSRTFEMGSKIFRFQPIKSDVLLKQILEDTKESPKPEKKSSHLMSHRRTYANNDSFSSDDDDPDENILDQTITEDDSLLNSRDTVPGVSWLDSPPYKKPFKIIAKPMPCTPMTNMFNKISIQDQLSARKEPRSVSVDRKDEQKLQQTPANSDVFKTPVPRSVIPSSNNLMSARRRQLELATPRQKLPIQPDKNVETPRHSSILHAAIHRNFSTPRSNLSSATKEDRILSSTAKKSDAVLREKNFNIPGIQRQRSGDVINSEIKYVPNKQTTSNDVKQSLFNNHLRRQLPNKQTNSSAYKKSNDNDEKQLLNKQPNFNGFKQPDINDERQLPNKQLNSNEFKYTRIDDERQLSDKQLNSNEFKQSSISEEKQLPNKQLNSKEFKQSSFNDERQLPNKQLNNKEFKQSGFNDERQLPNKQLNSKEFKQSSINEFKQSSISEERQLPNKQLHSNESKQSSISEERYLSNKQLHSNEFKQSSIDNERQLPNKRPNSNEFKQSSNNEGRQLINKQSNNNEERQVSNKQMNSNEFKQSSIDDEKQLPKKRPDSNEFKQSSNSEERQLINKQSNNNEDRQVLNKQKNSNEFKQSSIDDEKQLSNKRPNSNEFKQSSNNEERQKNQPELKQASVQINIAAKSLKESTFKQLKVKGIEYIVINKIGEGGSGQVYRCLEPETLQDRAIKVVNLNVDSATRNSYINEVKMLQELQGNDRVIRMYDFEQINQNLFVVMEKGDVDFAIFLRNLTIQPQIQTHVIICYWIEMLKCVREIHEQGIIHSDIKPSNFLLVGGRLKLIDFGIASRLNADMTSIIKNIAVGTFNYISPEALLDSRDGIDDKPQLRISYKSDVWSLGCILYQMVYKRTPFQFVGSIYAKFAIIVDRNHKIEYPEIPGVPLYLIEMIKKCLVYDMRSRPTVEELLNMYYSGNCY